MSVKYLIHLFCILLIGCKNGDTYYIIEPTTSEENESIEQSIDNHVHPENSANPNEYDLNLLIGTWIKYQKNDSILIKTGEVIGTSISANYYVIEPFGNTIEMHSCEYWPEKHGRVANITDKHIYWDVRSEPYHLLDNGNLEQNYEYQLSGQEYIKEHYRNIMIKVSDEVITDFGEISISGEFNFNESDHVCVNYSYNLATLGANISVNSVLPDNEIIEFNLDLKQRDYFGEYNMVHDFEIRQDFKVSYYSGSDLFSNVVQTSYFEPDAATLNILQNDNEHVNFSILSTANGGIELLGEFEIDIPPIEDALMNIFQ